MIKIMFSAWQDIWKNKIFNVIIFLEILVLIIVAGMVMQNANTQSQIKNNYDEKYAEAIILNSDKISSHLGKEGLEEFGASATKMTTDGAVVTLINSIAATAFKVKHSGKWFSSDVNDDYAEALVAKGQKQYVIGEIYTINYNDSTSRKIHVIGYLGKENLGINISQLLYENFFAPTQMMLLDNIAVSDVEDTVIVCGKYSKEFYINTYNFRTKSYAESYGEYMTVNYTSNYNGYYWVFMIVALVVAAILCNSLFQAEVNIRRNVAKYIVGQSRVKICITEIVKATCLFIVPFLLDLLIVVIFNVTIVAPFTPILRYDKFFLSTAIVFVIYAISTLLTMVRVLRAKPLVEIRK